MSMFLSMLTADAAAQHGHEFSRRAAAPAADPSAFRPQVANQRRLPLPRNPLSAIPRSRSPHGPSPMGPRRRTALLTRSQSLKTPTIMEISDQEVDETQRKEDARTSEESNDPRVLDRIIRSFTVPGSFNGPFAGEDLPSSSSSSESVSPPEPTTIPTPIHEPIDPVLTTVSSSNTTTTTSEVSDSAPRQRRPKSTYRFGHPPPTTRQKKILRPKVLLQLQEKANSGYHKPIVEVVPGSRFTPRTRIGQKLQRMHRKKDGTGADDLVVVKCDGNYNREAIEDEMLTDAKDVMGIIQPAEDGPSAYITIDNDVWRAALDGRGASYTLELVSDCSQKIRWYVPKAKRRTVAGDNKALGPREFSCTSLLPDSTKHPVVASMTEAEMQVYDQYSSPLEPDDIIQTNEALRRLILVSGFWVYFCEGWSSHYDFSTMGSSQCFLRKRANSLQPSMTGRQGTSECGSATPSVGRAGSIAISEGPSLESSRSLSPQITESRSIGGNVEKSEEQQEKTDREAIPTASPEIMAEPASESIRPAPHTLNTEDVARRRGLWHIEEACPDATPETSKGHGRVGTLARRMSLKVQQARRFSTQLPQERRQSLPLDTHTTRQYGSNDDQHKAIKSLRRLSQHVHLPILARPKSTGVEAPRLEDMSNAASQATQFHADVMHMDTLEISEDESVLLQQPFCVALHPNEPFLSNDHNELASITTPFDEARLSNLGPDTLDPVVTNEWDVAERIVHFEPSTRCTSEDVDPYLASTQHEAGGAVASNTTPSRSTTSSPAESVIIHDQSPNPFGQQGWWQQYDRFLESTFEQDIITSTPRRSSMQAKTFAVTPSPASTVVDQDSGIAMMDGSSLPMERVATAGNRVAISGADKSISHVEIKSDPARTSAVIAEEVSIGPIKAERRMSSWREKLIGKLH